MIKGAEKAAKKIPKSVAGPKSAADICVLQNTADGEDGVDGKSQTKYGSGTPAGDPDNYDRLGKGKKGAKYKNKTDGSVWEKDVDEHGGSKWKRWPSEKAWEKNTGRESVRDDGSVR